MVVVISGVNYGGGGGGVTVANCSCGVVVVFFMSGVSGLFVTICLLLIIWYNTP